MDDAAYDEGDPLAFPEFIASTVMVLSVVVGIMILPLWPLLGAVPRGVGFERVASYVLVYSPVLLVAAIGTAFVARRHGSWLLLAIAASLPFSVLAALVVG
jgi:hypothetical protein